MKYFVIALTVALVCFFVFRTHLSHPVVTTDPKVEDVFRSKDLKRLKALIGEGFSKDYISPVNGQSLLHMSVNICRPEFVKYLISIEIDPTIEDHNGCTAFDIADANNFETLSMAPDGGIRHHASGYEGVWVLLSEYDKSYRKAEDRVNAEDEKKM